MRTKKSKKRFSPANLVRLAQRATLLDRSELSDNLDTALSVLSRYVAEYRRTRHPDLLAEAKMSAEAVYSLLDELLKRDEPPLVSPEEQRFPEMQKIRARQVREHY